MVEARNPMWVHCTCGHEWVPLYLPAEMGLAAKVLKAAVCPMCHTKKHLYPGKFPRPVADGDADGWIVSGDTGISSVVIWSVMRGVTPERTYPPSDPADFGRCYRLLKVMPSWRPRLGEVAAFYPAWAPLVAAWDELTALYEEELQNADGMAPKLYNRMRELRGDPPVHDTGIRLASHGWKTR